MVDIIIHDMTIDEFAEYDHDGIGYLIGTGRVDVIDEQPTVDAEPVVRCKDCKYYNEYPSGFGCCEIHKGSIAIQTPLTFCAWGERREDEVR